MQRIQKIIKGYIALTIKPTGNPEYAQNIPLFHLLYFPKSNAISRVGEDGEDLNFIFCSFKLMVIFLTGDGPSA